MASSLVTGTGPALRRIRQHPYHGRPALNTPAETRVALAELNKDRDNDRGPNVEVDYYFEIQNDAAPLRGLITAGRMLLDHGTIKPWHSEGDAAIAKPPQYDGMMSWATDLKLLGHNGAEGVEAGIITIAYPLAFFDKAGRDFPLATLCEGFASEPFSAFLFYQGAKVVDVRIPASLAAKFPGVSWPHRRVRDYLGISEAEPIIGTIVKPKTGLTPELFSRCVVEAALAGARFTKADENMHLTLGEITSFVSRTVRDLTAAGFDLSPGPAKGRRRFLFAPHISGEPDQMIARAQAAVEAGANALMFTPYYAGGFQKLSEITRRFDVPCYGHTAGMNVTTGSLTWGIDSSVMYRLAAQYGSAFMQLTAVRGYLKPDDDEKGHILATLRRDGLEGADGMTLVIAGGLGPANLGANMQALGMTGRMFLAGTSVYSHPDGASSGVKALILAYRAFREKGATEIADLIAFGRSLGAEGQPLVNALVSAKQAH
jgi:ribulose 1,5-bisphosphate carboxylase large subunit-like protein